jgi:hypothetical protein
VGLPLLPAARVALAQRAADLAVPLPAAIAVLGLHYAWALSTGVPFEQASIEGAERRARRVEGLRRGHLSIRRGARPPFALSATGHPAVALYWKNLTAAVRVLALRVVLVVLLPTVIGGAAALTAGASFDRELGAVLCAVLAASAAVFGVQICRVDFRLDLGVIDVLKTFPLRGIEVAVAEVLAPFTVLVIGEWIFVAAAAILAPVAAAGTAGRAALAATAMIVLPAITLLGLLVQNAVALLFPAWVESGAAPPRGIEAIGQRLLTLVGTLLAVSLALVPAAVAAALAFPILHRSVGGPAWPIVALLGAAVVAGESAAAFAALGRAFDRFDPGQP